MGPISASQVLLPFTRAVNQLDDPIFRGVLIRSVAWSAACFIMLYCGTVWSVHRMLEFHGWLAWGIDVLGSIAASLLAFWLFLPLAALIGTIYIERIARSVEQRFYPWLPTSRGASLMAQAWDGVEVALKVLGLNILALVLAVILPGVGVVLGWMIAAYAIGRGLFVAVAMRRMPRPMAESLYRHARGAILAQGGILALAAYIPVLNLLIPILGTAAMVHILDMALTAAQHPDFKRFRR